MQKAEQLVKAAEEEKFFMSSDCSASGSEAGARMSEGVMVYWWLEPCSEGV